MNIDFGTTLAPTGMMAQIPSEGAGDDSDSFDCARGRMTLISGVMGNAAGGDLTITVEDSADDLAFAAVSGVAVMSVTALDKGTFSVLVDHRAVRRYVRMNVVREAGGNTRVAITALTFHGESGSTNGVTAVIA